MARRFKRYLVQSPRASHWNYGGNGRYFIPLVTHNRIRWFGRKTGHGVELSEIGTLAEQAWRDLERVFPFAGRGPFVVMPEHIHFIIEIKQANPSPPRRNKRTKEETPNMSELAAKRGELGTLIRWYKARVTSTAWKKSPAFRWAGNYYDVIIRDEEAYRRIAA